jgi:hypothetical protein
MLLNSIKNKLLRLPTPSANSRALSKRRVPLPHPLVHLMLGRLSGQTLYSVCSSILRVSTKSIPGPWIGYRNSSWGICPHALTNQLMYGASTSKKAGIVTASSQSSSACFIVGSLVFVVCWSVLESDIEGAFSVGAYIVAACALFVAFVVSKAG